MGVLTWLDLALIGILLLSALIGLIRGLFREAMSLAVWVTALWVAGSYAWLLSPYLSEWIANGQLRLWAARLIMFLGVLIVGGLGTWLLMEVFGSESIWPPQLVGLLVAFLAMIVGSLLPQSEKPAQVA